jgi:isocitrate dehydrogenase
VCVTSCVRCGVMMSLGPKHLNFFNHVRPLFGTAGTSAASVVQHQAISMNPQGKHVVPNHVRIPYIEGEGIGPEIMKAAQSVVDNAVKLTYGQDRSIEWFPILAGIPAVALGKDPVPPETIDAVKQHHFFVKGPLNTPKGKGMRSVNVWMRNFFDMFACVRPVKNIPGVVSPMKQDRTDIVLFRENTEDTYCGIEYPAGSEKAQAFIAANNAGEGAKQIRPDAAIGIKPSSPFAAKRLTEKAILYALEHNRPSITVVHKGNIMKDTEGAIWEWAKELAREKYPNQVVIWEESKEQYGNDMGKVPKGKVILQDRLTDAMFQDVILNPHWHSVLVAPNLTGDFLSDALAATVGGLGVAPGANIGEKYAMFEATHGTAPDIAGQNKANPTAMLLSMQMMLDEMNWDEAAVLLGKGIEETLKQRKMTGDLAKHIPGTPALSTSAFCKAIEETMSQMRPPQTLSVA